MRLRHAKEEKYKRYITPMLAQLTDQPAFDNPEWLFEIKWDGYRAVAEIRQKDIRLYSRNGLSFTRIYGKVVEALKKLRHDAVLDGEIVVFDENDRPNFQKLQNYTPHTKATMHYFVFDILSLDGKDLTATPLLERKKILSRIIPADPVLRYCDHVVGDGVSFFDQVRKADLEGIIAKRCASLYYTGRRSKDWLKIKNVRSDEAIIVGFTEPKGSRVGFGSLLLAQIIGEKLTYIGNVGTGFTDATLRDMQRKFSTLITSSSPLEYSPVKTPPHTTWLKPRLVCNVKFTEKTSDGLIRHPVFMGLRMDKKAAEVKPEKVLKRGSRKKKLASR